MALLSVEGAGGCLRIEPGLALCNGCQFRLEYAIRLCIEDQGKSFLEVLHGSTSVQLQRCLVDMDELDQGGTLVNCFGVQLEVGSHVLHSCAEQLFEVGLDVGEVFLPEGNRGVFEEPTIAPFALSQRVFDTLSLSNVQGHLNHAYDFAISGFDGIAPNVPHSPVRRCDLPFLRLSRSTRFDDWASFAWLVALLP